jgi:hypothetical protein
MYVDVRKFTIKMKWLVLLLCLVMVFSATGDLFTNVALADDDKSSNPYLVEKFLDEQGREICKVIAPGKPPEFEVGSASVPERRTAGAVTTISDVPALDWSYGCSATSAAMLFGYYDRTGYGNMYTGPLGDVGSHAVRLLRQDRIRQHVHRPHERGSVPHADGQLLVGGDDISRRDLHGVPAERHA